MTVLDDEKNFLKLLMLYAGTSEVPPQFFYWAGMTVLSASIADRVWVQCADGRRIIPNLYVMLVGPSGSGKEQAITTAARLAHEGGGDIINMKAMRATRRFVLAQMSVGTVNQHGKTGAANPKLYLVTEELGDSLYSGDLGWDFITMMTALYKPPPYPYTDGTSTHGMVEIHKPCVNWLAGTTEQWLKRVVPADAMEGGFLPRVVTVRGERDPSVRHPKVLHHPDRAAIWDHLLWRVSKNTWLDGPILLTDKAEDLRTRWYETLPAPEADEEKPMFNRRDEMIHRFAALSAMADHVVQKETEHDPPEIEPGHMEEAIHNWTWLMSEIPHTLKLSKVSTKSSQTDYTGSIVQRGKGLWIDRSTLLRKVGARGMGAKELDEAVQTLLGRGEIEVQVTPTTGRALVKYRWRG